MFEAMKRGLGAGEWLRRVLGAGALASVAFITLGLDTRVLGTISSIRTDVLEQHLLQRWYRKSDAVTQGRDSFLSDQSRPAGAGFMRPVGGTQLDLPVEGSLPEFKGATAWLNSDPLTAAQLRGKVVLVDIWTFDCINCLHALPYVRAWAEKYRDEGLVVVGVHSPEFAFERKLDNVKRAVRELGLTFPIAVDNDFAIWRAFNNQYWPAQYFVDARGRVRYHKFGEGDYERSEQVIRQLLQEAREGA
jgi:thiol-disulfide isomerase/thioredoxin